MSQKDQQSQGRGVGRVFGKVALVTGGASGMGKADAQLLAQEGATVFISDLDETGGTAVASEINEQYGTGRATFFKHNVTDEEQWKQVLEKIKQAHGRLDILVNNAGIMKPGSVVDTELADWKLVNSVNVESQFLACKHAIPLMEASGEGGSIINMSSTSMVVGMSYIAAYSASKGAVDALTRNVAAHCIEAKNGIRVNSIQPDGVKTPLIVKMATGKDTATKEEMALLDAEKADWILPEDIANTVLFLASSESRCINGIAILIDQGACMLPQTPPAERQLG